MKKLTLLWVLFSMVFLSGCSWFSKDEENTMNNTKPEIDVESCNNYFELVNCIIDNDTDDTYSAEDRELIRESVDDMYESWATLDDDTLSEMCSKELSKFDSMRDYLWEIGCSLN